MAVVSEHGARCGIAALSTALGLPPATYYRVQKTRMIAAAGDAVPAAARAAPARALRPAWDARCYHETFIPLFFRAGELRRQGLKASDVDAQLDKEIKGATLELPATPTAGYRMLGPANAYDPKTGAATPQLRVWQSIHMPYRTAAEIGLPDESELRPGQQPRGPYVMRSGTWWAHAMIVHEAPGGNAKAQP